MIKRRGKGIAVTLKGTPTPTSSTCLIKVNQDADVTVICTTPETGGGQRTIISQLPQTPSVFPWPRSR